MARSHQRVQMVGKNRQARAINWKQTGSNKPKKEKPSQIVGPALQMMFTSGFHVSIMTALIRSLIALVLTGTTVGLGQSSERGWGVPNEPQNCEMNLQNLEYLRDLVKKESTGAGFLIIVARLGKGERQPSLNHRRLYNVRLKLTLINVSKDRIITTEGEQVKGFGRLEFYWRGELVGAFLVNKAKDICVGCCGPDERFYPYKRKGSRIKRNHAEVPGP